MEYTFGYYTISLLILMPAILFTGRQAAERILTANGMGNLPMKKVGGALTDYYDSTFQAGE